MKVLTAPFFGPDQTYQGTKGHTLQPVQDGAGLWIVGKGVLSSPYLAPVLNGAQTYNGETKPMRDFLTEVDYTPVPVPEDPTTATAGTTKRKPRKK